MKRAIATLLVLLAAGAIAWGVVRRLDVLFADDAAASGAEPAIPVRVGPVEHGSIALRRTFSGALESAAEFVASPKVTGRVRHLAVDLGDEVTRGQVVARLDDAELVQDVRQAEADLAVAKASEAEAKSALEIAGRELKRAESLRKDGVASESQLDASRSLELSARAHVEVAVAGVTRAEAAVEAARIRLGYAGVIADWSGDDGRRVVAERYVDEGGTVAANGALLSIVQLDPIVAVVFAPERDYARLAAGQTATLATDAYPGRAFEARVARIAPVFRRATRQARVELSVANPDELLKPGMFVRATIDLGTVEDAVVVPFDAVTERGDELGLFVLDAAGERVAWRPVTLGVREGARVQVFGDGIEGRVVVLGQELCDDGSRVSIPGDAGSGDASPGSTDSVGATR